MEASQDLACKPKLILSHIDIQMPPIVQEYDGFGAKFAAKVYETRKDPVRWIQQNVPKAGAEFLIQNRVGGPRSLIVVEKLNTKGGTSSPIRPSSQRQATSPVKFQEDPRSDPLKITPDDPRIYLTVCEGATDYDAEEWLELVTPRQIKKTGGDLSLKRYNHWRMATEAKSSVLNDRKYMERSNVLNSPKVPSYIPFQGRGQTLIGDVNDETDPFRTEDYYNDVVTQNELIKEYRQRYLSAPKPPRKVFHLKSASTYEGTEYTPTTRDFAKARISNMKGYRSFWSSVRRSGEEVCEPPSVLMFPTDKDTVLCPQGYTPDFPCCTPKRRSKRITKK